MIRSEGVGDGAYRAVTIDRPASRNALRPADLDALAGAVRDAREPVVLLRGAGSAFCAGADLGVVERLDDPAAFADHGQRVARAVESADAVTVAGVDGAARGGGVELALACDLRVATPDASFAESGAALGLFGAWGGTARLPRIVGEGAALDLSLSARTVDADEALALGLVSRVVDDPAAVAREVAANDSGALRELKRLVRAGAGGRSATEAAAAEGVEEVEAAEREAFARLHATRFGGRKTGGDGGGRGD